MREDAVEDVANARIVRSQPQVGGECQLVERLPGRLVAADHLPGPAGQLAEQPLHLWVRQQRPAIDLHLRVVFTLIQQVAPDAVADPGWTVFGQQPCQQ